jgi:hypothetical protein
MLKRAEVVKLVKAVAETREVEIGCHECFGQLDRYAEAELSGLDAAASLPLVGDHLAKCADCHSTLEALRRAVRGT